MTANTLIGTPQCRVAAPPPATDPDNHVVHGVLVGWYHHPRNKHVPPDQKCNLYEDSVILITVPPLRSIVSEPLEEVGPVPAIAHIPLSRCVQSPGLD